jgi:2,4-diaminopentanoate dehydrogenase
VLVHHEEKEGRDAGDLAGINPIGVAATRDVDALVAPRADCMLWQGLKGGASGLGEGRTGC